MSSSSNKLDYAPFLADLLQRDKVVRSGLSIGTTIAADFAATPVPIREKLDAAIAHYCTMYAEIPNGLGSLKQIGRAKVDQSSRITTTDRAWEFQAWVPFASRRVVTLEGAVLTINLKVHSGAVDVGILAEDGSTLLGDRYRADVGEHEIRLTIPSNEVKGAVICNCGPLAEQSVLELLNLSLRCFVPDSPAAEDWKTALIDAESNVSPETDTSSDLVATAPLCLFHLLQIERFHDAQLLINAAKMLEEKSIHWWPTRLEEFLQDFLRLSRETPTLRAASPTTASANEGDDRNPLLDEWEKLFPAFGREEYLPLHFEIIEAGLLLDLLGMTRKQKIVFKWERESVAAPQVRRGILTHLIRVLDQRLDGKLDGFSLVVSSGPESVSVTINSDLKHGDLQYRHFSRAVAALLQSFNSSHGQVPDLKHDLGDENRLILTWEQEVPSISLRSIVSETSVDSATEIYHGDTGSRVIVAAGICYKFSPIESSKRLSIREEGLVRSKLSELGICSAFAATHGDHLGDWASYPFTDGKPLSDNLKNYDQRDVQAAVTRCLSDGVSLVNQQGVQHRDLRAENVLVSKRQELVLLDYDQAEIDTSDDDFGNEWDEARACAGFGGLLKQLGWEKNYLQTAGRLGFAWELGRHSAANSPGKHACYYGWNWGPFYLSGERPWTSRWHLLRQAFSGGGGRFLELGSNLGLLSTYASLEGWEATGWERDGVAVDSARLIASALGASASFQQADLQNEEFLASQTMTYDLVSALSVVHWLPDPKPVEAFLGQQKKILFEGHRSASEEKKYLAGLGFSSVELLGYSERLRPVLIASKTSFHAD